MVKKMIYLTFVLCFLSACVSQHNAQRYVFSSLKDKVLMTAELPKDTMTVGETVTISITYSNISDETVTIFKDAYLWLAKDADHFGDDVSLRLTPQILYPKDEIEMKKGESYKQEIPIIVQKPFFVSGEWNVKLFYVAYRKRNGTDVLISEIGKIVVN